MMIARPTLSSNGLAWSYNDELPILFCQSFLAALYDPDM